MASSLYNEFLVQNVQAVQSLRSVENVQVAQLDYGTGLNAAQFALEPILDQLARPRQG
jgi:hypothetical protein